MPLPQEIIRHKRDGLTLNRLEIQSFVDGLVNGDFNDAQVGAMAMAIVQQGMNVEETVALTMQMMHSGDVLQWPDIDGPVIDKHSTGGVGDKVSFMLAAIVAANGAYVPMISGRGLGHTGGTVDKLESIAGFNAHPDNAKFQAIVKDVGMAIIGQTGNIAPADKRLYAIRDVTATAESTPLITASILSKKLSAGLGALVMDVKVGNGAMMQDMQAAKTLAQSIVNVANGAGVHTQAIITDMNQVLGSSAGNAVEIIETLHYLSGDKRESRLHRVVTALACSMLMSAGLAEHNHEARQMVEHALTSGKAAEVFARMVAAMGGPADLFECSNRYLPSAKVIIDVFAPKSGVICAMQTRDIGMAVVRLGGGRLSNEQEVDHSVGFDSIVHVGKRVSTGDVIARVHARSLAQAEMASNQYVAAIEINEQGEGFNPVIFETISASK
ncbi:thymidine phosphorylase [Thalassotalea sp. ND16A]|uniref:thymidine phosphorylase n=1 Tax=Thalassotalea sp. ND16A TaxID=1535422 RepID=UPI00051A5FFF|nr:thymidine phosphorylase [Thalassotalea sp. ND16A]KGJ88091.1 Thymidine phosphorylase [Thalassotalea sp. ND16A]